MTIAAILTSIRELLEGVSTESGAGYRLARTADEVEGRYSDRAFELEVTRRLGPLDTGIEPRVIYEVELRLQTVPGGVDLFADMERSVTEARDLARAIESSTIDVLVGETSFERDTETHVSTTVLRAVVRET